MYIDNKLLVGKSGDENIYIYPKMANRHGLIAGATGTGKTVTLKVLAESFSECGVPVFMADAKGDLAGMAKMGEETESVVKRVQKMGLEELGFKYKKYPATFWDVYQKMGLPLRTTVSEIGPTLLAKMLELNDTQTDVLTVVFKIADDERLLLIDTKDLKSMLKYVGENTDRYSSEYGNLAKQSLNAIVRAIVALESVGADKFFGEAALDIYDWFGNDIDGRGKVNILDCQELMQNPDMYATFMLWMMSELYETLPEAGDLDRPRMIFFFDEAHMLFANASKSLMSKVEQIVKLIRSKGVGIYFITQNPSDIPDGVLSQLGNKFQHALHAYTPNEQKAVKAAANSFRINPEFNTYDAILELGIGQAVVSVLDEEGVPTIAKKVKILPPQSNMGAISDSEREACITQDRLYQKYASYFDRDSAHEFLIRMESAKQREMEELKAREEEQKKAVAAQRSASSRGSSSSRARTTSQNRVGRSVAGTVGREVGNQIGNAIGGKFGKRLGGNLGAEIARGLFNTYLKG